MMGDNHRVRHLGNDDTAQFTADELATINATVSLLCKIFEVLPRNLSCSVLCSITITVLMNICTEPALELDNMTDSMKAAIQRAIAMKDTQGSA